MAGFEAAFDEDLEIDANRGITDAHDLGEAHDQIADLHRLEKLKAVDGHRGDAAAGAVGRNQSAGNIDLAHEPAAKDVAMNVDVLGTS